MKDLYLSYSLSMRLLAAPWIPLRLYGFRTGADAVSTNAVQPYHPQCLECYHTAVRFRASVLSDFLPTQGSVPRQPRCVQCTDFIPPPGLYAFRSTSRHTWISLYPPVRNTRHLRILNLSPLAYPNPLGTKEDLSVAYSPGVAEPCLSIKRDIKYAYDYTAKGHLVGVVTNGTAVLGLGNIGPAAAKPVMEGKAVLFKKFADIDAFDIELAITDPEKLVDMVVALEPTFGGINLEDIKAPECFYVEKAC